MIKTSSPSWLESTFIELLMLRRSRGSSKDQTHPLASHGALGNGILEVSMWHRSRVDKQKQRKKTRLKKNNKQMLYGLTILINTIVTLMILKWPRKRSFENRSSRPYKMQKCSWTTSKKRAAITPLQQVWRLTLTSLMALYRAILNPETMWMSKEKIRRIKKKFQTMRMQLSYTKL